MDHLSLSNMSKADLGLQPGSCELFIFMLLCVCFVFLYVFAFPFVFQQNLSSKNSNLIQFKPVEKNTDLHLGQDKVQTLNYS